MLVNMVSERVERVVSKQYSTTVDFEIEVPPRKEFGDLSTNVAMKLAKQLKKNPREIAQEIAGLLIEDSVFDRIEVMGPGFINFFLSNEILHEVVKTILEQGEEYGRENVGKGLKIQFEYGSANPTGPFTVGHGRQIVIGDVLSEVSRNSATTSQERCT